MTSRTIRIEKNNIAQTKSNSLKILNLCRWQPKLNIPVDMTSANIAGDIFFISVFIFRVCLATDAGHRRVGGVISFQRRFMSIYTSFLDHRKDFLADSIVRRTITQYFPDAGSAV